VGGVTSIEDRLREGAGAPELDVQRFAARASEEGLVDVAYARADSPLGPLLVASTDRGLVCVSYLEFREEDATLERIATRVSPRVLEAPAKVDGIRRELDDYFSGRLTSFSTPIDWALVGDFGRRVLSKTAAIPYGDVATYGDIARGIGSQGAARATGNALGANPMPIVVPCHRVVASGGKLGGYTGGVERKQLLLSLERGEGEPEAAKLF
jgi:methylated-DNA-[protein]-cysteine S-methyltransferase